MHSTQAELWDSTPTDVKMSISSSSFLPQIKLTSSLLQSLYLSRTGGLITASHASPEQRLLLTATRYSLQRTDEVLSGADYCIHTGSWTLDRAERLLADVAFRSEAAKSPLDLSRVSVAWQTTRRGLTLRSHVIFPSVDLQLTPIPSLKVVASPLSLELVDHAVTEFQMGYVTLDKAKRAILLLQSDPIAGQLPLVGVWVAHLPSRWAEPSVWTACVQFILNSVAKVTPSPHSFLLIQFAGKPKFFEVSVEQAAWTTRFVESELHNTEYGFPPYCLTFLNTWGHSRRQSGPAVRSKTSLAMEEPSRIKRPKSSLLTSVDTNCTENLGLSKLADESLSVPRIEYETPSCSFEDERVALIQQKYLNY